MIVVHTTLTPSVPRRGKYSTLHKRYACAVGRVALCLKRTSRAYLLVCLLALRQHSLGQGGCAVGLLASFAPRSCCAPRSGDMLHLLDMSRCCPRQPWQGWCAACLLVVAAKLQQPTGKLHIQASCMCK